MNNLHMKQKPIKKLQYIAIGLILLYYIILFREYIFGNMLYLFTDIGTDTIMSFYPLMLDHLQGTGIGPFSTWSFHRGIGNNIFSSDMLDVTTWPIYFMNASTIAKFIIYRQLFRIFIALFFLYQFLRLREYGIKSSIIGTTLFAISGYLFVSSGWYGHTQNIMFFTLFIYCLELWLKKGKWWPLPLVILVSFDFQMAFLIEFLIIYLLLRWSDNDTLLLQKSKFPTFSLDSIKIIGISLMLIAPFIGSKIYQLIYSPRIAGSYGYTDLLQHKGYFQLESWNHYATALLRSFSGEILGSGSNYQGWKNYLEGPVFYIGLPTLLLFAFGFSLFSKLQKKVYGAVLIFWLLLVVFPHFRYAFYFFTGDYYKTAVDLYLPFTLWLISMNGIKAIFDNDLIPSKKNTIISLVSLLLIFGTCVYSSLTLVNNYISIGVILFLIAYSSLFTIPKFIENNNTLFSLLFLLILSEGLFLSSIGLSQRKTLEKSFYARRSYINDYTKEALKVIAKDKGLFFRTGKTYGSAGLGYNDASAQGYYSTRSYDSHNHNNYVNFLKTYEVIDKEESSSRWIVGLVSSQYLQPFFSIKYLFSTAQSDEYIWKEKTQKISAIENINIYKNNLYLDFGIPIYNYIRQSEFKVLSASTNTLKHLSIYKSVLIGDHESEISGKLTHLNKVNDYNNQDFESLVSSLVGKTMKMTKFSQTKIEGNIELDKSAVVVFTMPYDVGWTTIVNGKKEKIHLVNNGLAGILLPNGKHNITLQYSPPFLNIGMIVAALGLLILLFIHRKELALAFNSKKTSI